MVNLIIQQSPITDSTELWGALNTVSEALGDMLRVVSHLITGEYFAGNGTNSSITHEHYTKTVSRCIDCSIRELTRAFCLICRFLLYLKGKILIDNVIEYVRLLSDSYLQGHTLPKEEPIQVRSPSLYFTLNRDFPAGFSGRNLHCGVGVVNLPENFGELPILMEVNKTALIVIDALVKS